MRSGPILAIVVAGGLFGWFAPDLVREPATPKASAAAPSAEASLNLLERDQWLGGEMALPRANDGHFYADVTIDDVALNMLVDTGASVVALTGEDAEAIGLTWGASEVRPVARGASGPVHGVPVTLERVQLGNIEARNVPAIVVPEGLGVSLLGQSFLSQIERVEIDQERMLLGG
jgi:aspartyl protease family protein